MLSKSTVALFLTEYIWSAIVSPVNRAASSQLSFNHKFLPIIARSGHSQEQWLNKAGWNSVNWSRKSENICWLCNVATLSPLSTSTSTFLPGRRMCEMFPTEEQSRVLPASTPPSHLTQSPTFYIPAFYVIHYRRANDTLMFHIWLQQLHFIYFPSTIIVHFLKIHGKRTEKVDILIVISRWGCWKVTGNTFLLRAKRIL